MLYRVVVLLVILSEEAAAQIAVREIMVAPQLFSMTELALLVAVAPPTVLSEPVL
jgi:hypothetical protein